MFRILRRALQCGRFVLTSRACRQISISNAKVPSADSALAVTELDLSAVDVEFGYPIQSWTFAGVSGAEVDILATAAAE